jgi:RNA polymerase sigma-70 factor (ECF subfamily)
MDMNVSPDQRIAAARLRTEDELGPLLNLYRGYLGLLARMEVGPKLQRKVDPSDLVQETLLDAHRQFPRFEGTTEAQFLAWLRRILAGKAANTVRHYLGTQGRNIHYELEGQLTESFDRVSGHLSQLAVTAAPSPSQNVLRREQSVLIADALQQLPDDYREVIVLRHWDELTFPEIARRMNRSLDSVEKLWLRAVGKLKLAVAKEVCG